MAYVSYQTEIQVANAALSSLRHAPLQAWTDPNSAVARALNCNYKAWVGWCFAQHRWTFAAVSEETALTENDGLPQYAYGYLLPKKHINTHQIFAKHEYKLDDKTVLNAKIGRDEVDDIHRGAEDVVYTNDDRGQDKVKYIVYTKPNTPNLWPPLFTEFVVQKLKYELAQVIGVPLQQIILIGQSMQSALVAAKHEDNMQSNKCVYRVNAFSAMGIPAWQQRYL